MNHRLNVPPELHHLIEKREQPDRRQSKDSVPESPTEHTDGAASSTDKENRRKEQRRSSDEPS